MGCGCGKPKPTRDNPMVLGAGGGEPVEVIANVAIMGLRAGERTWVLGAHVDTMVEAGWVRRV